MVLILPEHSQRPYRYGMTLLCIGAMFNWLGLADNNAEPVRYIGVTLIAAGAMLICLAMCFWMKATHDPQVAALQAQAEQEAVHHIVAIHASEAAAEKPPDYDTVTGALPPSYEDAVKHTPALALTHAHAPPDCHDGAAIADSKPESEQSHQGPSGEGSNPGPQEGGSFGSKVLRISRRFLGRSRSHESVEGGAAPTTPPDAHAS